MVSRKDLGMTVAQIFVDLFVIVVLAALVVELLKGHPVAFDLPQRIGAIVCLSGLALFAIASVHKTAVASRSATSPQPPAGAEPKTEGAGVVGRGGKDSPGVVGYGGDGGPGVRGIGAPGAPGVVGIGGPGGPGIVGIGGPGGAGVEGIGGRAASPNVYSNEELRSMLDKRFNSAQLQDIGEELGIVVPGGPMKKSEKLRVLIQDASGIKRSQLIEYATGKRKL